MTSYVEAAEATQTRSSNGIAVALRGALLWPIVSLLITGMWHFAIEAVWPDLHNVFVPAVLGPILLAYGAWAGYGTAIRRGGYFGAIVAGVIVGMLPLALDTVGFGLILGRGLDTGSLAGIFGFSMVLFGALWGGGYSVGRETRD